MSHIDLQPSAFDRLDPAAQAIRWWTSQMLDIFGRPRRRILTTDDVEGSRKRVAGHITIDLGETDGFLATARLPRGPAEAHRKALDLQLADLAPIPLEDLIVSARAVSQPDDRTVQYSLAMARRDRLDALEKQARDRGARSVSFRIKGSDEPEIISPNALRRRRRSLVIDASIAIVTAIATIAAVTLWTMRLDAETAVIAEQEREVRGLALAAQSARNQERLSHAMVERGVLERRSMSAMSDIATLNRATPDGTWWSRLVWTPSEITASGQSRNATAAIAQISGQAKAWRVELAGALAAAPEGMAQSFEIVLKPRKGTP